MNPAGQETKKVRVWGKGQFTIPAEFRKDLNIDEDTVLEVFRAGRAIIAMPEALTVRKLASSVLKEMKQNNIQLEDLLKELREGDHEYEAD